MSNWKNQKVIPPSIYKYSAFRLCYNLKYISLK